MVLQRELRTEPHLLTEERPCPETHPRLHALPLFHLLQKQTLIRVLSHFFGSERGLAVCSGDVRSREQGRLRVSMCLRAGSFFGQKMGLSAKLALEHHLLFCLS